MNEYALAAEKLVSSTIKETLPGDSCCDKLLRMVFEDTDLERIRIVSRAIDCMKCTLSIRQLIKTISYIGAIESDMDLAELHRCAAASVFYNAILEYGAAGERQVKKRLLGGELKEGDLNALLCCASWFSHIPIVAESVQYVSPAYPKMVRLSAMYVLKWHLFSESSPEEASKLFSPLLSDADPQIRLYALSALMFHPSSIEYAMKMVDDLDQYVRGEALDQIRLHDSSAD